MMLEDACGILGRFLLPLTLDEFLDRTINAGSGCRKIDGDGQKARTELLGPKPDTVLLSAFHLAPKLTFHSANPLGEPPDLAGIDDADLFRRRIAEFHARNYSVRFPELRPLSPALDRLARALETVFHQPVTASAFWSHRGMRAPVHFDDHDLIVVQLRGEKRWYVSQKPSELNNTWKTVPTRAATLDSHEIMDLRPGDLLYLPRGTLHSVDSGSESLHLSIGFTPLTVREALIAAVDQLSDLERPLRTNIGGRLAFQLRGQGLEQLLPPLLGAAARLTAACKTPEFLVAALQRRSSRVVASLSPLTGSGMGGQSVNLDTWVEHADTALCHMTANAETIDFSYPGGHEYIHVGALDSVVYIVNTPRFRAKDVGGSVGDDIRLSLVARFLAIGFLQLATPTVGPVT